VSAAAATQVDPQLVALGLTCEVVYVAARFLGAREPEMHVDQQRELRQRRVVRQGVEGDLVLEGI